LMMILPFTLRKFFNKTPNNATRLERGNTVGARPVTGESLGARGVLNLRRKKINKHLRVQVLTRDGFKCRMCGRSRDEVSLEVDHIIPVSQGGTDELQNLATLCRDCNAGKSDYKFPDYASMTLIPDNLEAHFKFCHEPKQGDYERYHLYCYFQQAGGSLSSQGKYDHTWKISDTEFAFSSNRSALEQRRKTEETQLFKEKIRRALAEERKRLILNEEGLVKVETPGSDSN